MEIKSKLGVLLTGKDVLDPFREVSEGRTALVKNGRIVHPGLLAAAGGAGDVVLLDVSVGPPAAEGPAVVQGDGELQAAL